MKKRNIFYIQLTIFFYFIKIVVHHKFNISQIQISNALSNTCIKVENSTLSSLQF